MSKLPGYRFQCFEHGCSNIPCLHWSDDELRDMGYPIDLMYGKLPSAADLDTVAAEGDTAVRTA